MYHTFFWIFSLRIILKIFKSAEYIISGSFHPSFNSPLLLSHRLHIVKKSNRETAFDAIVLIPWHSCQLMSVVKLELLESVLRIRYIDHYYTDVAVHNSLMIWLAGQARQQHGAIITDGEAVCAKQTQVDTEIYVERSCAIHLNRGNILWVVLTSFNHGGNWCIFL